MRKYKLVTYCKACGNPIDIVTDAVMIRILDQDMRRYLGEGPFHAECAKSKAPAKPKVGDIA
jgi:hypothetical protein